MPFRTAGANAIRQAFLDFFTERHGHAHVPSSPSAPLDDPTLLFTNAGMNQFKPIFLGTVDPSSPLAGLRRAANSQKCIRAGGKHNDLEDVGRDTYHHTFFEMLGNWSFGDYFKAEAIEWAWEFMTGVIGLPKDRFYATYFGGDEAAAQAADVEARDCWLRHLPESRVLPFGMKDNFWEMGDTGPCGPCSELHFDRIGDEDRGARPGSGAAAKLVNADDPDVIELWNLVFIQYDRQGDGSLRPLPAKHVDTGMGFERLVSVISNRRSNYDTDVFSPIFGAIERITRDAEGYHGRLGLKDPDLHDTAYRVIADHARTLTVAIADGATPSNEGRGYVLRRILRRAVRFGRQRLNAPAGLMEQLVPVVAETLVPAFPELGIAVPRVVEIVRDEEASFARTLDRGIAMFDELAGGGRISGEDAFRLYDTYGFPVDLTQQMAEERGIGVDVAGFDAAMEEQKARSRASAKFGAGEGLALSAEAVKHLQDAGVEPTDDSAKFTAADHGAESIARPVRTTVRAIWTPGGFEHHAAAGAATREPTLGVIVQKTPFYAEMGGQIADTGKITVSGGQGEFAVDDVRSYGGYVLHIGRVLRGELRVGAEVSMVLDVHRRRRIAANHTATHLLNLGLREHVAPDTDQKGSKVADDELRFDFNHSGPVDPAALALVEDLVRQRIADDLEVFSGPARLKDAKSISGLRAVFGETYPDPVRVVSIGRAVEDVMANPADAGNARLSIEFCGGTHLRRTSQAGEFALVGEEGIGKGIRRVTCLTGDAARHAHAEAARLSQRIGDAERMPVAHLESAIKGLEQSMEGSVQPIAARAIAQDRIAALRERVKQAGKAQAAEAARRATEIAGTLVSQIRANGDQVSVAIVPLGADHGALQAAIGTVRAQCEHCSVMFLSPDEAADRTSIIAGVSKEHIARGLRAGDWVREVAGRLGGKGGGKPDLAQGSGGTVTGLRSAADHGRQWAYGQIDSAG